MVTVTVVVTVAETWVVGVFGGDWWLEAGGGDAFSDRWWPAFRSPEFHMIVMVPSAGLYLRVEGELM